MKGLEMRRFYKCRERGKVLYDQPSHKKASQIHFWFMKQQGGLITKYQWQALQCGWCLSLQEPSMAITLQVKLCWQLP